MEGFNKSFPIVKYFSVLFMWKAISEKGFISRCHLLHFNSLIFNLTLWCIKNKQRACQQGCYAASGNVK